MEIEIGCWLFMSPLIYLAVQDRSKLGYCISLHDGICVIKWR